MRGRWGLVLAIPALVIARGSKSDGMGSCGPAFEYRLAVTVDLAPNVSCEMDLGYGQQHRHA